MLATFVGVAVERLQNKTVAALSGARAGTLSNDARSCSRTRRFYEFIKEDLNIFCVINRTGKSSRSTWSARAVWFHSRDVIVPFDRWPSEPIVLDVVGVVNVLFRSVLTIAAGNADRSLLVGAP